MVHVAPDRSARRAQRRRAILEAARGVVHEGGVEALKLAPLAKRLGYAVGALYRYFDSKEALLAALEVDVLEELAARLDAAAARAAHPLGRVLARARVFAAMPVARPEDFALLGYALGDPRVLVPGADAGAVFAAAQPIFAAVATDLEAAREAGALAPGNPLDRAIVLWSGLQGTLQTRKLARVAPEILDADRLARELVQSLLLGWGATHEALDAARRHLDTLPEDTWS